MLLYITSIRSFLAKTRFINCLYTIAIRKKRKNKLRKVTLFSDFTCQPLNGLKFILTEWSTVLPKNIMKP